MGAPLDVAVAYSRRSTFGSELGGGDPDATQLHPPATCQHALSRVQSGAEQCDPEDSQMQGEAPKLQFSLSGNLSDCSETLRADVVGAVGAMRRQNSCMSLDDDYITENAIMEDPRDETSGTAGLMEPSLPKHVQGSARHQAVQWQQCLQRPSTLSHSPHHHVVAAPGSCLKQRPKEFSFWFADQAKLSGATAASCKSFNARIKSIEGKQGLQQQPEAHSGSKRTRRVLFD